MTTYQYCFYKKCEPWNWGGSRRWCRKCWPRIELKAIAISEIDNVADCNKKSVILERSYELFYLSPWQILKLIFLNGIWFVWDLGVLIGVVDVPEDKESRFSLSGWQDIPIGWQDIWTKLNLRRGEPRMQREKRKLKVKQKRREEKMEKEINMVYLKKIMLIILSEKCFEYEYK